MGNSASLQIARLAWNLGKWITHTGAVREGDALGLSWVAAADIIGGHAAADAPDSPWDRAQWDVGGDGSAWRAAAAQAHCGADGVGSSAKSIRTSRSGIFMSTSSNGMKSQCYTPLPEWCCRKLGSWRRSPAAAATGAGGSAARCGPPGRLHLSVDSRASGAAALDSSAG